MQKTRHKEIEMATRGVFALLMQPSTKRVLISERADGKGWNLPGGRVEAGESDQAALVREVKEETGLDIEVLEQIGNDHVHKEDTAVAYACRIIGGQLTPTDEAKTHRYCTAEELQQGSFRVKYKDWEGEVAMTAGYQDIPVKLIGPEGRLGRTGRMVWDALSLMQQPERDKPPFEIFSVGTNLEDFQENVIVCLENCFLTRNSNELCRWMRLDPHSPNGCMQESSQA